MATLGVPESRLITIQPWEQRLITEIEKAIMKSDLGLTPNNDGKTIKLNIPQLTEERRKQLVKVVKKRAEEARVAVRNIRRDILEETKRIEKEKHISEDEVKRFQEEVQKLTEEMRRNFQLILAGMTPRDLEHQRKVLDQILRETGGWNIAAVDEPALQRYVLLFMIKLCFKNLYFTATGGFIDTYN